MNLINDRTIPHNLEAEMAILGAILMHSELYHEAAAVIDSEDFFRDAHRRIFEKMHVLAERQTAIDLLTVKEELTRAGELDEIGGPVYLTALADGIPRASNVAHYAEIVREKARLRGLIYGMNKLVADAYDAERGSADLVESGVTSLLKLADSRSARGVPVAEAVGTYIQSLENDGVGQAMATGFAEIDELLIGGVRPGELAIVAARPSVGKSSWALGAALHLAHSGHPTVFFSLEMSVSSLAARVLSWRSRIHSARLARRLLNDTDWSRVANGWESLTGTDLLLEEGVTSMTQIAAWCHRLRQRDSGLACAVIDYLQLLVPDGPERTSAVAAVSRGLKRIAKEHGIAVIALSQLSRAPEARADKRPQLSDLRESGALEQDADVAILLFREEMHKPTDQNRGVAEAIVAKQRNGPTGVIKLVWQAEYAQFQNTAHVYDEQPVTG